MPDLKPIFLTAYLQYFGLKILKFFVNGLKLFLYLFKNKIIFNIVKFTATKRKDMKPFLFFLLFDPGRKKNRFQDSGSG